MKRPSPFVDAVTKTHSGVVITFNEGETALYSHALLREALAKAEHFEDAGEEDYKQLA